MKKRTYIYTLLCIVFILLGTINCTDDDLIKSNTQVEITNFSLQEAREYFQNQAKESLSLSRSLNDKENKTVSPGDFVPNWSAAVGSLKTGLACYDVPIAPTYRFKAIFVNERNGVSSAEKVNVYQKLVIVKDIKSEKLSQYILTLIPSKLYDKCNGAQICDKFINCGDKAGFTGVAIYSCVYSQVTARVSAYKNGIRTQGVFLLNTTNKDELLIKCQQARVILSTVSLQKGKVALTRGEDDYSFDGGWLDEVIITPEPDYEYDWESENEKWLEATRPGENVDPEPGAQEPQEPEIDDYYQPNNNPGDVSDIDIEFEKHLKDLERLLREKGIDLSKYDIRRNIETCGSNARTMPDGTIELCDNFFDYDIKDQMSMLWHEIYHANNEHNVNSAHSENDIELKPSDDILDKLNDHIDWYTKGYGTDFVKDSIREDMLQEQGVREDPQWYRNEIETYKAELENGIDKSDHYQSELEFMLWKYEEVLEQLENKQ